MATRKRSEKSTRADKPRFRAKFKDGAYILVEITSGPGTRITECKSDNPMLDIPIISRPAKPSKPDTAAAEMHEFGDDKPVDPTPQQLMDGQDRLARVAALAEAMRMIDEPTPDKKGMTCEKCGHHVLSQTHSDKCMQPSDRPHLTENQADELLGGVKLEASKEKSPEEYSAGIKAAVQHSTHWQSQPRDGGEFSSHEKKAALAERQSAVKADLQAQRELKQEETWFKAMEAIGITHFLHAFFWVAGAGAGGASVYWVIERLAQ